MKKITAKKIYYQGKWHENLCINLNADSIANVTLLDPADFKVENLGNVALLPGTINTYTHSFQSLLKGFYDDRSFFDWREKGLYKTGGKLKAKDLYIGALFSFAEMLKSGITTVCDFFYHNYDGHENAEAVIQAARELGIRLVLARCFYDWEGAPQAFRETPKQAYERCLQLMKKYEGAPMVTIYSAPHSLHAASEAMLLTAHRLAQETESDFHIHLAEGRYEKEMVQKQQGCSPLIYLKRLGLCSSKMVAIHGVWLDSEEIAQMGEAGCKLSYNPSSNMFLGDGITRIPEMMKAGVVVALGTDGGCSNNRQSIFEEMRMTALLQKVAALNGETLSAEETFQMGTENGGIVLGLPIGKIEAGYKADFVTVRLDDLSLQPVQNLHKNIVYSMVGRAIDSVVVNGKDVVRNGELLNTDETKIINEVSRLTQAWEKSCC